MVCEINREYEAAAFSVSHEAVKVDPETVRKFVS